MLSPNAEGGTGYGYIAGASPVTVRLTASGSRVRASIEDGVNQTKSPDGCTAGQSHFSALFYVTAIGGKSPRSFNSRQNINSSAYCATGWYP
jgi:hypothetical protein